MDTKIDFSAPDECSFRTRTCTLGARGFFSLFFAAKIERKSRDRDERVFFPLVTIAASPLNFRREQQEKKPFGTQGIVPASFAVQCVKRKTHLSKYYKETCARNFSCSYSICTKHPHGKNVGDRVGRTCLETLHASGNIQLGACFQAQEKTTSLISVFSTYVETEWLKKLKWLRRRLMALK